MSLKDSVASAVGNVGEFLNPFDGDAGFSFANVPIVKSIFKDQIADATQNEALNKVDNGIAKAATTGIGGIAGAVIGSKLGDRFGLLGNIAGGVVGAWLGSKIGKEFPSDIAAAIDYMRESTNENTDFGTKASRFATALMTNFTTEGQTYTGKTTALDADPDPM